MNYVNFTETFKTLAKIITCLKWNKHPETRALGNLTFALFICARSKSDVTPVTL